MLLLWQKKSLYCTNNEAWLLFYYGETLYCMNNEFWLLLQQDAVLHEQQTSAPNELRIWSHISKQLSFRRLAPFRPAHVTGCKVTAYTYIYRLFPARKRPIFPACQYTATQLAFSGIYKCRRGTRVLIQVFN